MIVDFVEIANQLFNAALTVLAGVLVFVAGQFIIKFFVEPIHEQAKLLGEIAYALTFYANVFGNADLHRPERVEEASMTARKQASQLRAATATIFWYKLWQILRIVPKQENVLIASSYLIGLSNSTNRSEGKLDRRKEIARLLDLKLLN